MCGICGWFSTNGNIDLDNLVKMNNIVHYRGPDDEGYLVAHANGSYYCLRGDDSQIDTYEHIKKINISQKDVWLGLGHRRLSILDLSEAGHQPMISADGTVAITYNGEIFNYLEIKQELLKLGYEFNTNCDTEVIINSYIEWGEECVNHFNGMWGFVIWDQKRRKIFGSRDRLGAKPFYYYKNDTIFLFSSELKQLCQNPLMPRKMNDDVLMAQIMYGISDYSEECLIEDAKVLQGGYNLVLEYGTYFEIESFSIKKYWDIDTYYKDVHSLENIFSEQNNAIRIRTRSDVPIGILLSGGLDSSILVAEVSNYYKEQGINPSEIQTFTSCYEDFQKGDEREFAHQVNKYCGTTERFIYADEQNTFELYKDMIWHSDGPVDIERLGAFMTLKEISKYGCKVLLNGQGSDETQFGYGRYYAWYLRDVLKQGGIRAFKRAFDEAVKNSCLKRRELIMMMAYFLIPGLRKLRCYFRMKKYVTNDVMNIYMKNKEINKVLFFDSLPALQYNELRKTQLTHILRWDERAYMAFSMESRVPFIDYNYVEDAVKIPEKLKIQNGYTKYLLRKNIEGHLPDSVVWRKNKMGWPSPANRWIDRFDREEVLDLFKDARSLKYFNIKEIKELYMRKPYDRAVDMFINIELFMRLFDVSTG